MKKEVLGWDGKPLLTPEEVKRQVELFKPMIDDLWTWKAGWSDAEKEA